MKTGTVPLIGWGAAVMAIGLLGAVVFDLKLLPTLLLAGSGAAAVVTGAAAGLAGRRRGEAPGPTGEVVSPDSSVATLALVLGGAIALTGTVVGQAFLWTGAGLAALGAGGLVRERLAARRALRARRPA